MIKYKQGAERDIACDIVGFRRPRLSDARKKIIASRIIPIMYNIAGISFTINSDELKEPNECLYYVTSVLALV